MALPIFLLPVCAYAQDSFPEFNFTGYADARLSYSSGAPSWLDRGLGKTRYGADAAGNDEIRANLAEAALLIDTKYSWELSSFVNLKFDPEQKNSVDVVEAFFRYDKLMDAGFKLDARLGVFYPHMSLENWGIAWTSPYSITPSAINSWIGEEVKTTGLEITIEKELEENAFSFTAAAFGFNDPSGTLLYFRGWALHDSKTTVFGEFPLPESRSISPVGLFNNQDPYTVPNLELDNRPGYYVGFSWENFGNFTVSGQYYDNRGDPEVLRGGQYAWETDFLNVGLTLDFFEETEIFGQFLKGNTKMGPIMALGLRPADVDYESFYIMVSHPFGDHRISARFDDFSTSDNSFVMYDNNNESGQSWMLAYTVEPFENQHLILELLHVNSDRAGRGQLGNPVNLKENQLQASYRVIF